MTEHQISEDEKKFEITHVFFKVGFTMCVCVCKCKCACVCDGCVCVCAHAWVCVKSEAGGIGKLSLEVKKLVTFVFIHETT